MIQIEKYLSGHQLLLNLPKTNYINFYAKNNYEPPFINITPKRCDIIKCEYINFLNYWITHRQ